MLIVPFGYHLTKLHPKVGLFFIKKISEPSLKISTCTGAAKTSEIRNV